MLDFKTLTVKLVNDYLKAKYGDSTDISIISNEQEYPYDYIHKSVKLAEIENIKVDEFNPQSSCFRFSCKIINEPNITYRFHESLISILAFIYNKDTY